MSKKETSRGSCECHCLDNNIFVESMVITLTIVSCMAVTGQTLISFDFMTVPKSSSLDQGQNSSSGNSSLNDVLVEDKDIMDILEGVFCYISLAIAGIFFIEIMAKIITLYKICIRNPWQVFDALVVMANAAVQATFYVVDVSAAVYCASFVIILRLWRIPFVCYMKVNQTRDQMDQDIELYRSGQRKAEERCSRLENDLADKREKIRKLEEVLQNISSGKQKENHTHFEPEGMDNSAFLADDEDIPLQLLAEIDGTKTYRSEDGIPMTSL